MNSSQDTLEFIMYPELYTLPHRISYLSKEFKEEKTCCLCESSHTSTVGQSGSHHQSYYFYCIASASVLVIANCINGFKLGSSIAIHQMTLKLVSEWLMTREFI